MTVVHLGFWIYCPSDGGHLSVNTDTRTAFVKLQPAKVSDSCDTIKIQYHNSTLSLPATIAPDWIANLLKTLA
jgi:hypothetical protein